MFGKVTELWTNIVEFFTDYVVFPLMNIKFINLLDILILSWMLYVLYKFVRDKHASKIIFGIVSLILLYIVSDLFNMVAINSILQTFYTVGIIAICIIFQPELRDMLEEFGTTASSNFKRITNRQTVDENDVLNAIEEISAAAFELSSKGEGALIVLERTGRLRNHMTEGTKIDAIVSRQLLCNIFVNRSPLHDGAVVVRNGRLFAAGCYLPLSDKNDIFKGLGTRHRAAIGLSEQSDAVVVVVSEETGTISIAANGDLYREFTSVSLRRKLFELLRREERVEGEEVAK